MYIAVNTIIQRDLSEPLLKNETAANVQAQLDDAFKKQAEKAQSTEQRKS